MQKKLWSTLSFICGLLTVAAAVLTLVFSMYAVFVTLGLSVLAIIFARLGRGGVGIFNFFGRLLGILGILASIIYALLLVLLIQACKAIGEGIGQGLQDAFKNVGSSSLIEFLFR